MNSMVMRLAAIVAIVVVVQFGFRFVGGFSDPPAVLPPSQPLTAFPMTVETSVGTKWHGVDESLDPRTFISTEAELAVSRRYRDRDGHAVTFFLAQYLRPSVGLYHSPMNCYRSNGYSLLEATRRPLKAPNRPDAEVSMSLWEKAGEKVMVVYWYEIDDHILYERGDLLGVRLKMMGKKSWPVMFKVLLEVPAAENAIAQAQIMDMAEKVREWLGTAKPAPEAN